ncbi:hypothetical protein BLA29_012493 [Euroglyphus maynei]|uniref:Uncharacterized protein n=1 Tax=Euroglyphus maynei TaxID=6958 RepID=A0A1Y3BSI3_EURMA|nr:hypothetical protein BLA29_012493 [Euroglyphus maynei]
MKIDSSDNVNEFIAELAPMKELKFWHDFIANLLCVPKTLHPQSSSTDDNVSSSLLSLKDSPAIKKPTIPPKPKYIEASQVSFFCCII